MRKRTVLIVFALVASLLGAMQQSAASALNPVTIQGDCSVYTQSILDVQEGDVINVYSLLVKLDGTEGVWTGPTGNFEAQYSGRSYVMRCESGGLPQFEEDIVPLLLDYAELMFVKDTQGRIIWTRPVPTATATATMMQTPTATSTLSVSATPTSTALPDSTLYLPLTLRKDPAPNPTAPPPQTTEPTVTEPPLPTRITPSAPTPANTPLPTNFPPPPPATKVPTVFASPPPY